jgi:hypothetical protein
MEASSNLLEDGRIAACGQDAAIWHVAPLCRHKRPRGGRLEKRASGNKPRHEDSDKT